MKGHDVGNHLVTLELDVDSVGRPFRVVVDGADKPNRLLPRGLSSPSLNGVVAIGTTDSSVGVGVGVCSTVGVQVVNLRGPMLEDAERAFLLAALDPQQVR